MTAQPDGWTEALLDDVVQILDSQRQPVNNTERAARLARSPDGARYPYFGATGQAGVIDDYLFDEDLILLGEDGVPFLDPLKRKAYQVSGPSWVNNHAHVLRARMDVADWRYACYALNSVDYRDLVTGSTRLKLTQEAMKQIKLPVAPINEQRRIADKLDKLLARIDACRERLQRFQALIARFRRSALHAAATGELTSNWRDGSPPQAQTVQFADVISESTIGLVRSAAEQAGLDEGLTPYLKMNNIGEAWGLSGAPSVGVRVSDAELARFSLRKGDWLFNTRNSIELVGKSCVWPGGPQTVFNNNILRVRFKNEVIPEYMEVWFRSSAGQQQLGQIKSATTSVAAIYQRSLMAMEIPVPPLSEQAEIVRRVDLLFAAAARLETRALSALEGVGRMSPAALAKAFRGELVPQDPADEPAQALLDRLRANAPPRAPPRKPGRRAAA